MDQVAHNINQGINEYIQSLISECLKGPALNSLSHEQKVDFSQKLQDYFYQVAFEVMVGRMTDEEFSRIEHLDPVSQEMINKVQQLASQIPGLAEDVENKLHRDVEYIKQNGQLPPQEYSF